MTVARLATFDDAPRLQEDDALEAAERAVAERPAGDRRGIDPTRVERWVVDASF